MPVVEVVVVVFSWVSLLAEWVVVLLAVAVFPAFRGFCVFLNASPEGGPLALADAAASIDSAVTAISFCTECFVSLI